MSRMKRKVFADDGCDADGRALVDDSQKGPIAYISRSSRSDNRFGFQLRARIRSERLWQEQVK